MATTTTSTNDKKLDEAAKQNSQVQYTLFASGLNKSGGRSSELSTKNLVDNVAILFDVVSSHNYSLKIDKTKYPVESRQYYSDNAVINDGQFSFTAKVTSAPMRIDPLNFLDKDTDHQNPLLSHRPTQALTILEQIARERNLITLVTEDKILSNYIITDISAKRDGNDGDCLTFDISISEFRIVTVGETILIKSNNPATDPKKAGTKNKGSTNSATDPVPKKTRCAMLRVNGKKLAEEWLVDHFTECKGINVDQTQMDYDNNNGR